MSTYSTTLDDIAHASPNPIVFAKSLALAVAPQVQQGKNLRVVPSGEKLELKDAKLKGVSFILGADYPAIDRSPGCMLAYDPLPGPQQVGYSYEAIRGAIFLGTLKEFRGPVFTCPEDMGLIAYLHYRDNVTVADVASLLPKLLKIYKSNKRGFVVYTHGEETLVNHEPVWPLGIVD